MECAYYQQCLCSVFKELFSNSCKSCADSGHPIFYGNCSKLFVLWLLIRQQAATTCGNKLKESEFFWQISEITLHWGKRPICNQMAKKNRRKTSCNEYYLSKTTLIFSTEPAVLHITAGDLRAELQLWDYWCWPGLGNTLLINESFCALHRSLHSFESWWFVGIVSHSGPLHVLHKTDWRALTVLSETNLISEKLKSRDSKQTVRRWIRSKLMLPQWI